MDPAVQRLLNDKLYEKRKAGALDLEKIVRDAVATADHERIKKIVHQLCHDFAYAVHQPHARNGGLIGLAAASIALGSDEVAQYLEEIVPPVLACFTDQDARVRYYACESMYNIAKVAKGEILLFFNDVFDALSKVWETLFPPEDFKLTNVQLAADGELSVKNGAELLDRLIKDIVSESAATYVSMLESPFDDKNDSDSRSDSRLSVELPTAFSLAKFIPLLQERIHVINPHTRMFLVSWLTILDTIPDLELVSYLPSFLSGLFKFVSDPHDDVKIATNGVLDRFLHEIKKIARIKRGLEERRKSQAGSLIKKSLLDDGASIQTDQSGPNEKQDFAITDSDSADGNDERALNVAGDWIPGQDVQVEHAKILDILMTFLDPSSGRTSQAHNLRHTANMSAEQEIQVTALRWIDSFFEICPEDILTFVPRLLAQVLPAMASDVEIVRQEANRVNTSLMEYIVSLSEEVATEEVREVREEPRSGPPTRTPTISLRDSLKESTTKEPRSSTPTARATPVPPDQLDPESKKPSEVTSPQPSADVNTTTPKPKAELDYAAAVGALTFQFLNEHEATRVAALSWLIMLHRKAPRKVLATNDGTFPALLKTLSDSSETVVTRDLQLLSQISRNSEDSYFASFMVNLLQLFSTDRKLLETRGNLIIRQLCTNLSAERIYRTLADCLEKDEDLEFASIMVQNLNNNLITAPELVDLRKRLRNLDSRDGQTFFVTLYRSWCYNAVATFSLCLLAQAYEQAYNLLQVFAELEMTVNMLIQIDKLVQLLESPVFTYLRLQLLEPERYPHLYKCLYGLLMLLPQSSAFAALKNRLNSVSAIGYLHSHPYSRLTTTPSSASTSSTYDRPNRLSSKSSRDEIRWTELLDKFKATQERSRRATSGSRFRLPDMLDGGPGIPGLPPLNDGIGVGDSKGGKTNDAPGTETRRGGARHSGAGVGTPQSGTGTPAHGKSKSLSHFGRLTTGIGSRRSKR
ncbi:MAG: hypothetical protein M1834_008892 [Cirrosporium novae-zelandiae]|nr:MAG: hypothetical protein M1834_008892 [Cirrosporium novae-zelandiae]